MIGLWMFAFRIALATAYVTLAVVQPTAAGRLAFPFGLTVLAIAIFDLTRHRGPA